MIVVNSRWCIDPGGTKEAHMASTTNPYHTIPYHTDKQATTNQQHNHPRQRTIQSSPDSRHRTIETRE